jgi:hypothetical protein
MAMWQPDTESVTGLAEPEEVQSIVVTERLLPMLGATPMVGRLFTKDDDSPSAEATAILTARLLAFEIRRRIPRPSGRRIMVNGRPRENCRRPLGFIPVPRSEAVADSADAARSVEGVLGQFNYTGVARLKPGATLEQATADVARLIPISLTRFPPFQGYSVKMFEEARLEPNLRLLKAEVVGDVGSVLWVLMGTIGLVLLIACANVANLLLVRAEGRPAGAGGPAALGASRGRIAYELLAESVILGLVGGAAGARRRVRRRSVCSSPSRPATCRASTTSPSTRPVLLFTLAISIVAGPACLVRFQCSSMPGPQVAAGIARRRTDVEREPRAASRPQHARRRAGALALRCCSSARASDDPHVPGRCGQVDPGFTNPQGVPDAGAQHPTAQVKEPEAVIRMHQAIMDKIAAIPGRHVSGSHQPRSDDRHQLARSDLCRPTRTTSRNNCRRSGRSSSSRPVC